MTVKSRTEQLTEITEKFEAQKTRRIERAATLRWWCVYLFLWVRVAIVAAATGWFFYGGASAAAVETLMDLFGLSHKALVDGVERSPLLFGAARLIGALLVGWRGIKVFALMGVPVSWGMSNWHGQGGNAFISGTEIRGGPGGDELLYGLIVKSHPNSQKLMRKRVVLLIMTVWPGMVLRIHESTFSLWRWNGMESNRQYIKHCRQLAPLEKELRSSSR